jgi:hypothetical protein
VEPIGSQLHRVKSGHLKEVVMRLKSALRQARRNGLPSGLPLWEYTVIEEIDPLRPSVSANVYSEKYFLQECEGCAEFWGDSYS